VKLVIGALDGLTDRFTSREDAARLLEIVTHIPGVEGIVGDRLGDHARPQLRMRQAGPTLFVEVSIQVSRVLPYAAIERVVHAVEHAITAEFAMAEVTVHWRPVRTTFEAPFESLKLIVAQFGLQPHNIELSETSDGTGTRAEITLDYHLEFPPGTALEEAHSISHEIEKHVRKELPQIGPIFVHLEEQRSDLMLSRVEDIGSRHEQLVTEIASYSLATNPKVRGVQDVHLYRDSDGEMHKLVLTAQVAPDLSLAEAHDIATQVEQALKEKFPELTRVVIHAEPGPIVDDGSSIMKFRA